MHKLPFSFFCILFFLFAISAKAEEESSGSSLVEQYQNSRLSMWAQERFFYAQATLAEATDAELIDEAVQDVVIYSTNQDEYESALQSIETAMTHLEADGDDYREAMLAKGKVLTRLGREDEAEILFQNAIANKWNHAMWRYSENLIENGDLDMASILEYRRIAGIEPYKNYRSETDDYAIFQTLLYLMKNREPEKSAIKTVYPYIETSDRSSLNKKIGLTLCLANDEEYSESLSILNELDEELSESKESDNNEYKNIALYKSAILFKQGMYIDQAQSAFKEYMIRNEGENAQIVAHALRIARDMGMNDEDKEKRDEVVLPLLNDEIVQNSDNHESISVNDLASLYDMYQQGLSWSGKQEESADICQYVVLNYFPQTLAGANCMMALTNYAWSEDGNIDNAEQRFLSILDISPCAEIVPWIHYYLSILYYIKKDDEKALDYISNVLDLVKESDQGSLRHLRRESLIVQNRITGNY